MPKYEAPCYSPNTRLPPLRVQGLGLANPKKPKLPSDSTISVKTAGGRGCNLVVAGTYKPDVQLLLLQGGDTHIGSSQQPCFLPLASVAISPLLRSAFQESFASPEEPPASPCKELPDQAIPESVQILPVDSSPQDIQVCHSNLLKHALG